MELTGRESKAVLKCVQEDMVTLSKSLSHCIANNDWVKATIVLCKISRNIKRFEELMRNCKIDD